MTVTVDDRGCWIPGRRWRRGRYSAAVRTPKSCPVRYRLTDDRGGGHVGLVGVMVEGLWQRRRVSVWHRRRVKVRGTEGSKRKKEE